MLCVCHSIAHYVLLLRFSYLGYSSSVWLRRQRYHRKSHLYYIYYTLSTTAGRRYAIVLKHDRDAQFSKCVMHCTVNACERVRINNLSDFKRNGQSQCDVVVSRRGENLRLFKSLRGRGLHLRARVKSTYSYYRLLYYCECKNITEVEICSQTAYYIINRTSS